MGVDSHEVMNTLVSDTKLNISPAYLNLDLHLAVPACRRMLSALRYAGRIVDIDTPCSMPVLQANENKFEVRFDLLQRLESGVLVSWA